MPSRAWLNSSISFRSRSVGATGLAMAISKISPWRLAYHINATTTIFAIFAKDPVGVPENSILGLQKVALNILSTSPVARSLGKAREFNGGPKWLAGRGHSRSSRRALRHSVRLSSEGRSQPSESNSAEHVCGY
jgi:hypothetical protein